MGSLGKGSLFCAVFGLDPAYGTSQVFKLRVQREWGQLWKRKQRTGPGTKRKPTLNSKGSGSRKPKSRWAQAEACQACLSPDSSLVQSPRHLASPLWDFHTRQRHCVAKPDGPTWLKESQTLTSECHSTVHPDTEFKDKSIHDFHQGDNCK